MTNIPTRGMAHLPLCFCAYA